MTVPNWVPAVAAGLYAVVGAFVMIEEGRKRQDAFDAVRGKGEEAVWSACCEYHAKIRKEVVELRAVSKSAGELWAIAEGWRACHTMLRDPSVPEAVKHPVLLHWWRKLARWVNGPAGDTLVSPDLHDEADESEVNFELRRELSRLRADNEFLREARTAQKATP